MGECLPYAQFMKQLRKSDLYVASRAVRFADDTKKAVLLNDRLKPALQIRFAEPATAERIWELMTMPKWTITYKDDDVREEDARITFDTPGTVHPYAVAE